MHCKAPAITKFNCHLLQPHCIVTLQCSLTLISTRKNDNIGRPYLLLFNCQQKLRQNTPFKLLPPDTTQSAVLPRQVPSFQLGTVTLAGCPSVRAINRSSGFPNALVFYCCCVTALRRVTLPHLLASYKGGLLYVLTAVYPAESWAPRVYAPKSCLSVRPSVCNVEISWSYSLEFLKYYYTAD